MVQSVRRWSVGCNVSGLRKVLIFNKSEEERNFLRFLLDGGDHGVLDTGQPLEALRIVQEENIGLMLIGSEIEGMSRQDLKTLIEKLRPGISMIFISPFPQEAAEFPVVIEEFMNLLKDYLRNMGVADDEITEMKKFSHAIVDRLLQIFQANDKYFFNNNHLVAELSGKIAVRMGLDETLVEAIQMAALLRDLGKLMIQRQLLDDKRRLSPVELTPMRSHPAYTVRMLSQVRFPWDLDSIIGQHHECYDGSGYPRGLKGRDICVGARIISIADAYYAMTTERPYRQAKSKEHAIAEIEKNAGRQFDPEIVEVFLSFARQELGDMLQKKTIVLLEREEHIAPMMRLNMPVQEIDVVQVADIVAAFDIIKHKRPHVIVIDLEALGLQTLPDFHQVVRKTFHSEAHFLILAPDGDRMQNLPPDMDLLVKPFHVDDLVAKVRDMLSEPYPAIGNNVAGLVGRLEDFDLADIIQILNLGIKTAKVEITRGKEKGILYLQQGKLVHASQGSMLGPEAFFELMGWKEGNFSIIHGQRTNEVNVKSDTMWLVLEGTRIIDERKTGQKLLGGEAYGSDYPVL
jgi:HD-GYP domain-containing protein (c-di-GMP phosphodiesterase class II)/DNA-binding response OmpR family regulator